MLEMSVTPINNDSIVPPIILIKSPPLTFLIWSTSINISVIMLNKASLLVILPKDTIVASLGTTNPLFWSPINNIKNPTPTVIECFKVFGIDFKSILVILVLAIIVNIIPLTNTAPKASCQLRPIEFTIV